MMITNFGIEEARYEGPVDTHLQAVSLTPLKSRATGVNVHLIAPFTEPYR